MKTSIIVFGSLLLFSCAGAAGIPSAAITFDNFKLVGEFTGGRASFTLTATAKVESSKGGSIELLSGGFALTDAGPRSGWKLHAGTNACTATFNRSGKYPISIKFDAALREGDGWKSLAFRVAPGAVMPVVLRGLPADTRFEFAGARPDRNGEDFNTYLPADGSLNLSWKEARVETEGKLFYSAEMLSQITVSPGLMRQAALLDFKVMQGELSRVALLLSGAGEVTRVQGDGILAWTIEPAAEASERRLVVQFNQPQKGSFGLQVQMQTPLGAFPQTTDAMRIRPEAATRFAGYIRIVNEGAVRLEVPQAEGLSQISPEQFPETDATKAALKLTGGQRFAYRFSGAEFKLRVQADQILPELAVSQLLTYRLGENELAIDDDMDLDIREAPLRELVLRVPRGYVIARVNAAGMSDYFTSEVEGQGAAELRLVFGQPVSGRQVVNLRLERNKPLGETNWTLPHIEIPKAKSVRGSLAVAADAGLRLTPERTQALTDIATAFFPGKVAGIQAAFRLDDANWSATMRIERLQQTVQADVLHIFSISEGIAYGSSVLNYVVSGAPVSVFKVELAPEYFNVEFTGKDIRGWQKKDEGYVVQLHTPVAGAYTLLATYERPFKAQGETLSFTGARPLDAQSEQGHTLITSAYQFQVKLDDISPGLLALEPGEVPAEYRLFFDAPILAAYRYVSRPFNLKLALSPLEQGDSLSQVVDRASLSTRISKEGQVLTTVRYFVKNRGNPHLRLTLAADTQLWSAMVNGAPVVPVKDAAANLIPLPQGIDPNAVVTLDLKLATRSENAGRVKVEAPMVNAPVMLAEWKLEPDEGQRLVYRQGTIAPAGGTPDISGFAQFSRAHASRDGIAGLFAIAAGLLLAVMALVAWRWGGAQGVYHRSLRHNVGVLLGLTFFIAGIALLILSANLMGGSMRSQPHGVTLLAPVQQANSPLSVEVANLSAKPSLSGAIGVAWPALLAVALWIFGWRSGPGTLRSAALLLGWAFLAWAALRLSNGFPLFIGVICAFLLFYAAIPTLRQVWSLPRKREAPPLEEPPASAVPVVALMLLFALSAYRADAAAADAVGATTKAQTPTNSPSQIVAAPTVQVLPRAEFVSQEIRVEDKFALATLKIRWQAQKGQTLPLLAEPAVLTRISFPPGALQLAQGVVGATRGQQLVARKSGLFDIEVQYQLRVTKNGAESGLVLPVEAGLVNQVRITVAGLDVDVSSPQGVSVVRELAGSNTVATLALKPEAGAWIGWNPRNRDVKKEKPVFYAELTQLYGPAAGVIEGVHQVAIRPAQGELDELVMDVPAGAAITDVSETARSTASTRSIVSLWRFDPDTRKLRVTLNPAQSRPFTLSVRSQTVAGSLPINQAIGLLSVEGAGAQIGLLGIATGNEVQLDAVSADACSAINLEDFPGGLAGVLQAQAPGLTVRRAFRYADVKAAVTIKASAVEPDVRVETEDVLSLGEDRTVLASTASVEITRAGIFRLSFVMPAGFDVESISGQALSHWTESKSAEGRVITLHLNGKTEGQRQFSITLAGPGVKARTGWVVPQLAIREASKQRGTLLVAPEQGLRLQVAACEGLTQLDPQKSGIKQKGVLKFRVLQTPRSLTLNLEQVDAWVQVTSLEHAQVSEALLKISANLQYQIENATLKSFRVRLPANMENVRFQGDQVADFLPVAGAVADGMQVWEIKLHRRVIGAYLLQATCQSVIPEKAVTIPLRGIQADGVNLQRGFVTVQSGGRVQVRTETAPEALQPTEWQSIPRTLQKGITATAANFAYRLVEPAFDLPLKIERHDPAKLLEARVNSVAFSSVVSDDGVMLTQARLEIMPGDKRLLDVTLPREGRFWFAFVNQNGVWPWREEGRILIPLEQQSRGDKPITVELFYSSRIGAAAPSALDLELTAPRFDLPLENLSWRVTLADKWKLRKWSGSFQLQEEAGGSQWAAFDLNNYLASETALQRERTKEAEQQLTMANTALEKGDQQQARRAFQSAYSLSAHDASFNEDARVQLHKVKVDQATIGLNVRQAGAAGDTGALSGKLRELRTAKEANYTPQDYQQILDRNSKDDNEAFERLAERIIQQQDAAVSSPAALRANIPEQGRVLTFKRSVAVDPKADLRIRLAAESAPAVSWGVRLLALAGTMLLLFIFAALSRQVRPSGATV